MSEPSEKSSYAASAPPPDSGKCQHSSNYSSHFLSLLIYLAVFTVLARYMPWSYVCPSVCHIHKLVLH